MKIAITSIGKDLESKIDPRFGRCQYFIVLDPETMEFTAHDNSGVTQRGGAGPVAVKTISDLGAEAVITGNVGPNAFDALSSAGIEAFIGASGTVNEAVEKWKKRELEVTEGASVASHTGKR